MLPKCRSGKARGGERAAPGEWLLAPSVPHVCKSGLGFSPRAFVRVVNGSNFVGLTTMPTINQLIRNPRVSLRVKSKSPALENSPQKRGGNLRTVMVAPMTSKGFAAPFRVP
eukprot:gene535-712_t